MEIKVSVIIATYNREDLVVRAINSVLSQTFLNYEIIVVDDGSTDGTKEKIEALFSGKVRYFYQKNTGPDVARDFGISNAKGEYIAILDSDDYWIDNNKLEKQVKFLNDNNDYILVGGNMIIVNEFNKKTVENRRILLTDREIRDRILIENPFAHSTVMYRKSAWDKVGGYGKNEHGFSEDWNLWLKFRKIGKCCNLKDNFTCFMAGNGYSFSWRKRSVLLDLKLRIKYKKDYPHFLKGFLSGLVYYVSFYIPFREQLKLYYSNCRQKIKKMIIK